MSPLQTSLSPDQSEGRLDVGLVGKSHKNNSASGDISRSKSDQPCATKSFMKISTRLMKTIRADSMCA